MNNMLALNRRRRLSLKWLAVLSFIFLIIFPAKSLQNHIGAHDPSSIIKDGDTYWIFTTGDGIYSTTSKDLVYWTANKTPYSKSVYPSWINDYVPGFAGTFWAPECIFMNGKYYLYYACSTFGSKVSCIGLATSPSLNNPVWTDEGVVVSSNNNSDFNAIDPDVFFDNNGKAWMTYGSWNTGIKMQEIDSVSGKPKNDTVFSVATFFDAENSQVVKNGAYYYLFVNRGLCCQGSKSTYYIQVGRATEPNGPYTGWKTILGPRSNYVGPGAIGYFKENETEYASFHYYDTEKSGAPTLAIGQFLWKDGWPVVTLDWIKAGSYKIINENSGLVWQDSKCAADSGNVVSQYAKTDKNCQVWNIVSSGNGFYYINSPYNELSVQTKSCSSFLDSEIELAPYAGVKCQLFHVEKTNTGEFIISTKNGNRILEIAGSSTEEGKAVTLSTFTGNSNQRWTFDTASITVGVSKLPAFENGLKLFPNPSNSGYFSVETSFTSGVLTIYNLQGKEVFTNKIEKQGIINISAPLKKGVYMVRLQQFNATPNQLLIVE